MSKKLIFLLVGIVFFLATSSLSQNGPVLTKAGKPKIIPLEYLKNSEGVIIKNKNGEPFILGQFGGYSPMKNFNSEHGLPPSGISSLITDNWGRLWIGTLGGGISCFDGRSFLNFTIENGLGNNIVMGLAKDKIGNIWIATDGGGMTRYDGKSFINYSTIDGLPSNNLRSILIDDKGNVWCGTYRDGISCFNGKSFKNYSTSDGLAGNSIREIIQDKRGNFWIATVSAGISHFDGKSFTNYGSSQGLASDTVYSLLEDEKGRIWLGTKAGASCFDGIFFYNFNKLSGLADNTVMDIFQDKNGNLWFGTFDGVSWLDYQSIKNKKISDITFKSMTPKQGLIESLIRTIFQDNEGNIWFGSQSDGITCFFGASLIAYMSASGLPNSSIITINATRNGGIWISYFHEGLVYFDGKAFYKYTTKEGLPSNDISSLYEDKAGGIWIGTDGKGLSYFDGKTFKTYTSKNGLPDNTIFSIHEDVKGNLWLGTRAGISCFNSKTFINYSTKEGLVDNDVLSMLEDNTGKLWMTTNEGVSCFDGKNFTNYTTGVGLANNLVFSAARDRAGNIWFGTAQGLSCLTANSGFKKFTNFTTANGLPDNFVTQVLLAPNGKIVAGTNYGIIYFDPETSLQSGTSLMAKEIFNTSTGYSIKDINVGNHCMYFDKEGVLWAGIGEKNTFIRFNYNIISKKQIPPAPIIKSIKVNDRKISWYSLISDQQTDSVARAQQEILIYKKTLSTAERDSVRQMNSKIRFDNLSAFYPLPTNLILPYQFNKLEFEFVAPTLGKPITISYQYILDGNDDDWSSPSANTTVELARLKEGTYTLRIRAVNNEGNWSQESIYTFTIRPPWWRTWWFRILAILILISMVFFIGRFIYVYQLRKQKGLLEKQLAVQYERQRISSDLHDDIGSTLSSINIYAGLAKKQPDNKFYLDSINQNVNDVVGKLDDLVWSIKTGNDTLGDIVNRITAYAEPTAKTKEIIFNITINNNLKEVKPPAGIKHHLYMAIKELINNSLKHADSKNISVEFKDGHKKLFVTVKDDGKGFDESMVRKDRNGLQNIQQRISEMNGKINILSSHGNGTIINMEIPA